MATNGLVAERNGTRLLGRGLNILEEAVATLWPILRSRRFILVLAAILIVDAWLAGLDMVYRYGVLNGLKLPSWFDLTQEDGFSEDWEYLLTTLAAITMGRLYLRARAPIFSTAAIIFVWLTLDNSVGIHEWCGALFAPLFGFLHGSNLHPQDLGELLTFFLIGAVVIAGLWRSARSGDARANILGLSVMACIGLAAGFGVFVDFAHAAIRGTPLADQVGSFVEEFGELVSLSLASALTLSLAPALKDEPEA